MATFRGQNNNAYPVHVRAQSPGDALDHWLAASSAFNFSVPDDEADDIRGQLDSDAAISYEEAAAGAPSLVNLGEPAAADAAGIHAAYAGNVALAFPGPFTNPDVPRAARVVYAAAYDGGDTTIVGTGPNDEPQTETIVAVAASTVEGTKPFKTVTSATQAVVGANAATASIGLGLALWAGLDLANADTALLYADGVAEAGTFDATDDTVLTTTAPNGAVNFKVLAN